MHYANGRKAKKGDIIVGLGYGHIPIVGVVTNTITGTDTCNVEVVSLTCPGLLTLTASECLLGTDIKCVGKVCTCNSKPQMAKEE